MGSFEKHLSLVREKLSTLKEAYQKRRYTIVGDLGIKVVEQLVEADAAKNNRYFGTHSDRHEYSNKNFPVDISRAMRRIWFAYGDLGYDGTNGERAKSVMQNLRVILDFFEKRFSEQIEKNI